MSKYNAKKVTIDGHRFDSQREGVEYIALRDRHKKGEIAHLIIHPRFALIYDDKPVRALPNKLGHKGPELAYFADFSFVDLKTGVWHVVDIKGVDTPVSRLKRAWVKAIYDVDVEIVK